MRQIYNVVRAREIEGRQGRKTVWDRVGVLVTDGERISLRLDAIPAGAWDGWLKAFPRDEARDAGAPERPERPHAAGPAAFDGLEEDIPF